MTEEDERRTDGRKVENRAVFCWTRNRNIFRTTPKTFTKSQSTLVEDLHLVCFLFLVPTNKILFDVIIVLSSVPAQPRGAAMIFKIDFGCDEKISDLFPFHLFVQETSFRVKSVLEDLHLLRLLVVSVRHLLLQLACL